jgi:hypothetical protein
VSNKQSSSRIRLILLAGFSFLQHLLGMSDPLFLQLMGERFDAMIERYSTFGVYV